MKHLLLVSIVLAACHSTTAPASPSTPDLAARRAQMLAWLHEYTRAGQFPQDAAGHPLSVFRDARGVRCPMAELIYRSGHGDLVDTVARTHNDLRLADVHDGPLYAWIVESGLTQEEIAMIQGAMTVEEMQWREQGGRLDLAAAVPLNGTAWAEAVRLAGEWGQVKGHLATAEVALRNETAASLQTAQTRRAPRTRPASRRTLETMR
jgi:hypothetical protein